MKIGIVWLPNVGKSTLFNALTRSYAAAAENFPFCTIEPNVGIVNVNDPRLEKLQEVFRSGKTVPATIEFVDIAWLVAWASTWEWLGNKFLSHIRQVDAVLEVVRDFENTDIHHVSGSIDAKRDIDVINYELILADLETVNHRLNDISKKARSWDKTAKHTEEVMIRLRDTLETWKLATSLPLTDAEKALIDDLHLITMKPFLYALNVAEETLSQAWDKPLSLDAPILRVSAKLEMDMLGFSPEERREFLDSLGITENPMDTIIRTAYDLLGLQYYFTAGEMESRAWKIRKWWTAPEAAGVIHTDFQKKFIKAETAHWLDLVELGGWTWAREKWKVRMEWKDYVVQDGDVMLFKFWA